MSHYKAQNVPYNKTGMEWEILGELAMRLHHKEEAKEAYQKAIETRFSVKAYLALLEVYTEQKDLRRALCECSLALSGVVNLLLTYYSRHTQGQVSSSPHTTTGGTWREA